MAAYPFAQIEQKWQAYWDENDTFETPDEDTGRPPSGKAFYVLDMFPYPSGAGLHVGHPEGYTATDIVARYKRMRGFDVLHPMGWDAFGLPAEQYAIETGTHPRATTEKNIANFKRQLKSLGFSYDWGREISTTDPDYYKWTQWIFLKLYEKGLAYQAEVPVWWCEALGTTLANEEVIDGKSERGGHPCERVPMRQWMLKITDYAERLLDGLDDLDWPASTKKMQRNWIGKSEGAEVDFGVVGHAEEHIRVFTTRPDTLFGATYMVLAPEHPLVSKVTTSEQFEAVDDYIREAAKKSELERTELQKEKTGVFTGGFAKNPVTGESVPIWIADYVLRAYGTGAIMAVPAHDERDYEFARKYDIAIREVVRPPGHSEVPGGLEEGAYTEKEGVLVNSDSSGRSIERIAEQGVSLNGLSVPEAQEKITSWLENEGQGRAATTYKLRDWLFSRQRFWGEPFPILLDENERPQPVPENELPVTLPEIDSYDAIGSGKSPLDGLPEWVQTTDPETGQPMRRETNTMPQWAGSCWYYLRFIDPHNDELPVDLEKEKRWMPVDLYVGGSEHAVLHLLYARFWHKVLYDAGVVSTQEPFKKLVHQGLILGEQEYTRYLDEDDRTVSAEHVSGNTDERTGQPVRPVKVEKDEVEKRGDHFVLKADGETRVDARSHKMSKSRGNVVNPDDVVDQYGADALRLYEMFMGPLEQVKPWSTDDVSGVSRFLGRAWRLVASDAKALDENAGPSNAITDAEPSKGQLRVLHQAIEKVTDDIEGLRFNTAIAALMEFVNEARGWDALPKSVAEDFVLLLSPFAPHLAEELHERLDHSESLAYAPWPELEEAHLQEDTVEMAVQVNGTVRATIAVDAGAGEKAVLARARSEENVQRYLNGKEVRREIYVPGRIVNFVVG